MPDFPTLSILSVDQLLFYERRNDQHSPSLSRRMQDSKVLQNPPVAVPLADNRERFLVLDGADQISAVAELGIPDIVVQVVEPDDPGLTLNQWNHMVWDYNPIQFLSEIRAIQGLRLVPVNQLTAQFDSAGNVGYAVVQSYKGSYYCVCPTNNNLSERVRLFNAISDTYETRARYGRTNTTDIRQLRDVKPKLSGLVIYPKFQVQDLLSLVEFGNLLPSGIARGMISPRALHLHYPLDELANPSPRSEKYSRLQRWVQERLDRKGVRYYAEPIYLFDE